MMWNELNAREAKPLAEECDGIADSHEQGMKAGRAIPVLVAPAVLGALLLGRSCVPLLGANRDRAAMPAAPTLYDHDPNHIWNRVHDSLLVRRSANGDQNGSDTVDPLLWANTKFLREPRSRRLAVKSLDDFLKVHAEQLIEEPIKRAVFQHDLWAVFDWAASGDSDSANNQLLLKRLAQVMRRVALTPQQVSALPDTYSAALASHEFPPEYDSTNPQRPFLPPDLLRPNGPWICLSGYSAEPTALVHFSGRSRFLVFLRLPGGRQATLEYLRRLFDSQEPLFLEDAVANSKLLNLRLPQFPAGTEVALLRQMMVIDGDGNLLPTALTESLQIRVYHSVTSGSPYMNYQNGPSSHDQDFFEFRFTRPLFFAQRAGGLRAVQAGEREFPVLLSFGIDPFEASRKHAWARQPDEILHSCRVCHADSGIQSVQSRERWLGPPPRNRAPETEPSLSRAVNWETGKTIERKQQQNNFKILLRYWHDSG